MSISIQSPFHPVAHAAPASAPSLQLVSNQTAAPDFTGVPRISSQQLLDGGRELVIQHQGGEYHLRLTRNDKLILTK
jgi:hemin uptake protein HemP